MLAALLTSLGLHSAFDGYLRERAKEAASHSRAAAELSYSQAGDRWTQESVDLLAHDLAGTGYDFRLLEPDGSALLDTTKIAPGRQAELLTTVPVRSSTGRRVATLQVFALSSEVRTPADSRFTRELDRWHLIAALLAGIVAVIVGIVTAAWLTRPLAAVSRTAGSLASGGRPEPVTVMGPPEVRRVDDALRSLAEGIERQRRGRRQLAQDLAHELRTPVMLIQSRLEAMQDGLLPVDDDGIAALHATTLRLGRLIGEIERLAESEASPRTLARERVSLDAVAGQAATAVSATLAARGLRMTTRLGAAAARGDGDAVGQILAILLSNAAKYAPADSEVVIETSATPDGWAEARVTDEGGALAGPNGQRVFERFHRGVASGAEAGLGLGLAIARDLAELMGGTLTLEATDRSTSFVLRLARADTAPRPVEAPPPGQTTRTGLHERFTRPG